MPAWKSDHLDRRIGKLMPALEALREGATQAAAIRRLIAGGLSDATARRRVKMLRACIDSGDFSSLAPQWKRPRAEQPWHALAKELGQLPGKPNNGEIAFKLRGLGYDVTQGQVRAYRKSLPSHEAETSPKRLGGNYHKLNHTPHVIRDFSQVPVGYQYESDGHTCDFYAEHPNTGGHFQPELTFWYDVRAQFIVDFWISGFENSFDIRMSLSRALLRWDNVPREIRVDNGAYRAKVLVDEAAGYCVKMSINPHFAIARNARSKCVEGEWGLFRGRCSKFQPDFLHGRTDDYFKSYARKWANNEVPKLSLRQCYDLIAAYVDQRNHEHRKNLLALDGTLGATPAEVWSGLVKNPVLAPAVAVVRPRAKRVVQNRRVKLDNRIYEARELRAFESHRDDMRFAAREVIVEYDDWHDELVWIYDLLGNFVCTADLVGKRAGIPESRVEERQVKQLDGQLHRLQIQAAEKEGRAQRVISAASVIDALEGPQNIVVPLPNSQQLFEQGHAMRPASPPMPPPPKPVDAAELAAVAALVNAERIVEPAEEPSADRFYRALALQQQLDAGTAIGERELSWLRLYGSSSEAQSLAEIYQAFGYLPGAQHHHNLESAL